MLKYSIMAETCSERQWNQHNKAARRRKHNLKNLLNNTVQQDAKIQYYGQKMQWKTVKTNINKAARRRKHNLKNLLNYQ
jgi:hypothetical protein